MGTIQDRDNKLFQAKRLCAALSAFVFFTGTTAQQGNKSIDNLDQKQSYAYVLTMDVIYKLENIRTAFNQKVKETTLDAVAHDESFGKGTFMERAQFLNKKYPEVAAVIRKQGISPMEYLLASHVLLQAFLQVEAKKRGEAHHSDPKGEPNPTNLAFVEQHWEESLKQCEIYDPRCKSFLREFLSRSTASATALPPPWQSAA